VCRRAGIPGQWWSRGCSSHESDRIPAGPRFSCRNHLDDAIRPMARCVTARNGTYFSGQHQLAMHAKLAFRKGCVLPCRTSRMSLQRARSQDLRHFVLVIPRRTSPWLAQSDFCLAEVATKSNSLWTFSPCSVTFDRDHVPGACKRHGG
jgi:hypothetical protein